MEQWLYEPNEYFWTDELTGYKCSVLRHKSLGHLCGYVEIPVTKATITKFNISNNNYACFPVDVHGGVTYVRLKDNVVTVGFDCAHLGDYCPGGLVLLKEHLGKGRTSSTKPEDYKNLNYVVGETSSMAAQIKDLVGSITDD